ncbi:hypothetical protein TRFO_04087 [Tritrichomonas foetus]|uniref:Exportin-1 C-terminal domain-containing protein n=1 Tax=Tritrichomonas foetus TaxID=1144522 RepID=A0A1J4KN50_9EUKA|nr:hypothetical protein TRFO_04087 [Tritrichomonas foetus]|eukprot:OHT11126.1 hypothetical protein TRFO_04087 [Tritrichomonas foetus]
MISDQIQIQIPKISIESPRSKIFMEDAFTIFYNLIQSHYSEQNDNKSESATKLLEYSSKIEYLSFLQEFLGKCIDSQIHVVYTFSCMKQIIQLRGCLLPQNILTIHYDFLKQAILANAQRFVSFPAIIGEASQAYAITFRIIIEQFPIMSNQIFSDVQNMFSSDIVPIKIAALYIMTSIVDVFNQNLPHLNTLDSGNLKKSFQSSYLHVFINAVYPLILIDDSDILLPALNLLCQCFSFCELPNSSNISQISYPREFSQYFSTPEILARIFFLVNPSENKNDPSQIQVSHKAFQILYFMAAATCVFYEGIHKKNEFFTFFASKMIEILNNLSSFDTEESIHEICKILNIIAKQLNEHFFLKTEIAGGFLTCVAQFSEFVFISGDVSSIQFLFNFWSVIANWKLEQQFIELILNIALQVIRSYIISTLDAISNDSEKWLDILSAEIVQKGNYSIWPISEKFHNQVIDIIIEQMNLRNSTTPTNLLQLAFLVDVISSRLGRSSLHSKDEVEVNAQRMYEAVVSLITATTPALPQMFEQAPQITSVFEWSIVAFIDNYQKVYFAGQRYSQSQEEKDQNKNFRQNLINIFVARILVELNSFAIIVNVPNLDIRILDIIKQLVSKEECTTFIENTPIKAALLNQSLSIAFEGVPPEKVKQPRIHLYRLYASLIKTFQELAVFLGKFDARFQELASTNYSNQNEIFALFCDLRGMFKHYLTDQSQSKKFVKVCEWFSSSHLEDSKNIIKNNSTNPGIVNITCRLWISLFPDRLCNNKSKSSGFVNSVIDPTSGFGIILFRTSLEIVGTVLNSCENNFSKFYILFKVIRYCLTTKYANFGVMSYYGDHSFYQMCQLFFQMLNALNDGFDDVSHYPKLLNHILLTMSAIISDEKCLTELFASEDHANLNMIMKFTSKCLLVGQSDLWQDTWDVLSPLLQRSTSSPEMIQSVQLYRPHTLIILQYIISKNDAKINKLGPIVLASYIFDADFFKSLVGIIINTYDETFRQYVQEQFGLLFNQMGPPLSEPLLVEFVQNRLTKFQAAFMKYRTNFINLPELTPFFQ